MSQECSDEALLDLQLSTEIAGYDNYKHRLGAEIEDIDQNPLTFSSVPGKIYAALKSVKALILKIHRIRQPLTVDWWKLLYKEMKDACMEKQFVAYTHYNCV